MAEPALDDFFQAHERAAADKEDAAGVDANVFLLWMLASALGRHVADGAFANLQHRLRYALARDIAGERNVLGFAGDFVDLVDVDDALLRALHFEVGILEQAQDDILHVLAHVAGLSERGGVSDGKRHVEDGGERTGEERLPRAGIADEQNIALLDFDVALAGGPFLLPAAGGLA